MALRLALLPFWAAKTGQRAVLQAAVASATACAGGPSAGAAAGAAAMQCTCSERVSHPAAATAALRRSCALQGAHRPLYSLCAAASAGLPRPPVPDGGDPSRGARVAHARAFASASAPPPAPSGGSGGSGGGSQPNALRVLETPLPPANTGPWKKARDPKTGGSYWWNPSTGAATPVGAPRPDAWVAVEGPGGGSYYWNTQSGATTAVGEPLPGPEGRVMVPQQQQQMGGGGGRSAAYNLVGYPLMIGLGFGLFAGLFRLLF
ncbi:MAG: hypothetical protein J3K34DRAFT_519399 [Monoraphidium minutum]|nr:MAG: hypothetical protein J3K34DRAFT_519399 [Monoraphidium minutum]